MLVTAPIKEGVNRMPFDVPTGLGYVAEALYTADIDYDVIDTYFGYAYDDIRDKIRKYNPDLLGISMFTHQYRVGYDFLREIKKDFPDLKIVAGGPHISTLRKKVLDECEVIDFAIVLEGEDAMVELCRGDDLASIKGLLYRDANGKVVYSGNRDFKKDLDSIPFPRYEKFEVSRYIEKRIPIISSRGCPYSCTFCPVPLTIGKKFRFRSPQYVIEEIKYWYGRGYKLFPFFDDNFTLDIDRVFKFCDLFETSGMDGVRLSCPNGVRADRVNRKLLARMKDVGFNELSYGVEVGNEKMLELIKKGESMECIDAAIKDSCELGFLVKLFFLIGSPGETPEDFEDSLKLAQKYPVFSVGFGHVLPFPGSELYAYVEENNLFVIDPYEYLNSASSVINEPVFKTPEMTIAQRKEAFLKSRELQTRILRNYYRYRLRRFGYFGKIFARLFVSDTVLKLYRNNPYVRKVLGLVKDYIKSL